MKRCAYCRAPATYRIARGRTRLFACESLGHITKLDDEARVMFGSLKYETTETGAGFTRTGRASPGKRKPPMPGDKSKTGKMWTGKAWAPLCKVCGKREHEQGCFRCGYRLPEDDRTIVRRVSRPKKANVSGKRLVVYDHDGADVYDVKAIVLVGSLRWTMQRSYKRWLANGARGDEVSAAALVTKYAEGSPSWRNWMRLSIERHGVRPRLDNPDHAEREVAALLRAKAAVAVLEQSTPKYDDPFGLHAATASQGGSP